MEPIAIVGAGLRFPGGAADADAFWRLLHDRVDAISEIPPERWDVDALYASEPAARKACTRWGGVIPGVELFDPAFFRIAEAEVPTMDPQQRLVLEVGWEALEDAGIAPDSLSGSRTGVFLGISNYDYNRLLARDLGYIDRYAAIGTTQCIAANRLSYLLNLQGPSLAIDTACSSSLVAIDLACDSLRHGQSDLALAGGVNLVLSPEVTISFSQAGIMARDGRCKSFAAAADGYVRADGCGMIVLKRLSRAIADGDRILAVVRGSAVNHDGRSNGLTAPRGPTHQAVMREALARAGVAPAEVSFVEAHGTGTALGDIIEMRSIKAVLTGGRTPEQRCAVGCVKTNIGHSEAASGIAGVIKVLLALQHGEIPPNLHSEVPNSGLQLESSPFFLPTGPHPWPRGDAPRIAGVFSYGIGGTNAFVVLEEPPASAVDSGDGGDAGGAGDDRPRHVLTLSARSPEALRELAGRYAELLARPEAPPLGDLCFTANTGRSHFEHRLAATAATHEELRRKLAGFAEEGESPGLHSGQAPKVPPKAPEGAWLPGADDPPPEGEANLEALAELYVSGVPVDWAAFDRPHARRKVALPSYPFQRQRYWMDQMFIAEEPAA